MEELGFNLAIPIDIMMWSHVDYIQKMSENQPVSIFPAQPHL